MMTAGLIALCGMAQAAFVTIGNAGNTADTNGYGAVGYNYGISATEVTIAEFQASGAGNENYWNDGTRTVGTAAPASYVSLYEAMKYCNWLTSGHPSYGAYQWNAGGELHVKSRGELFASGALYYVLPTEDEWYKAAYYTGNSGDLWSRYANGTDTVPTWGTTNGWNYYNGSRVNASPNFTWTAGYGGEEQNGTYDMMGNVWEWMETSSGVVRGGDYKGSPGFLSSSSRRSYNPSTEADFIGFRVVAIPEPATAMLVFFGAGVGVAVHRLRRSAMRR
jgi:formylglycine-generating enzyme required for sulfatase activity